MGAAPAVDGERVGARDQQQLRLLEACVARLRDCVIIAEVDRDGRPVVVYVNDAFVERTGYSREEVLGGTPAILHGPDTQPEAVARIEHALATGQPHREEILSYTKQKEPLWLELDLAPVTDGTGRVTHWISIERDVTSRKAVDEELRRSEEQYRMLFAQNPMPMWAYDIETLRFCAVNDAAIAHYGYTREQFLAMTIADIRPVEDVPALRGAIHDPDVGLGKSGIWRHRTADGRILHVEISSHKIELDGRPARVVLANDVTRELAAVEALRASEASLARAQRIAHLGSWEVVLATNVLSWSDEIYRIFDIDRSQFGATYDAFLAAVHPDDRAAMHAAHLDARNGRGKLDLEHRIIRPDGGVRWVHELGELECDASGKPIRLTGIVHDITDRKDLERQLLRSQRLESIGTLAGGVAHDLNNVLQPIVIEVETLRDAASTAGRLDDLLVIERCAQRGAALVRQLLSFARGSDVPRVPLDLTQVSVELRKLVRDTFPKNIEIAMYVEPNLRCVRANATELQQVLLNLCVNARDAMPAGGSLRVCFTNVDISEVPAQQHLGAATPGRHVVIEVSDSGTGIAPDVMDRMFDPFFTTKEPGHGTGLGLATAHAIVCSHGGFMTVDSVQGNGSTFRVFLPSTDDRPAPAARPARAGDGTGQTILVVDDESHIRAATQRVLERHGYRVRTAANGRDALEVIGTERVAAVVLDLAMPDLDGVETVASLAKLDPGIPVIGASGLPSSDFMSSVRYFLPKPYTATELLAALADVIAPA